MKEIYNNIDGKIATNDDPSVSYINSVAVINNLDKEINLIGIDNHALMANVAVHKANLMQQDVEIFHQDALEFLPSDINLVISDLATYDYYNDQYKSPLYDEGVRYFPYLAIEHYLNLEGDVKYIYVIDNNFFAIFIIKVSFIFQVALYYHNLTYFSSVKLHFHSKH